MGTLRIKRGTKTQLQTTPGYVPEEGELVYTTDTKEVFVGDGATTGGTPVSVSTQNIEDLGNVQALAAQKDQILVYNGSNWAATDNPALDLRGNIYADDSTLLVDAVNGQIVGPINTTSIVSSGNIVGDLVGDVTGSVTGNVVGDTTGTHFGNSTGYHTGDVTGSIFQDNSSLLLDGIDGTYYGGRITVDGAGTKFFNNNSGSRPELRLEHIKSAGDTNMQSTQGAIRFQALENDGTTTETSYIAAGTLGVFIVNDRDLDGSFGEDNTITLSANGIGYKTYTPQEGLDIRGNGVFTGTVTAASFTGTGSVVSNGSIEISGARELLLGRLTTAERDALTAENGMIIYNTSTNKFQGYENGAWVNLV